MTEILNSTDIAYFGLARPLMKAPDLINRFSQESERQIGKPVKL
jgi:hypothetical protein